jgi:hypothetical protein
MKKYILIGLLISSLTISAQNSETIVSPNKNTAFNMLNDKPGLSIGGYGEIHYIISSLDAWGNKTQSIPYILGTLDAQRLGQLNN